MYQKNLYKILENERVNFIIEKKFMKKELTLLEYIRKVYLESKETSYISISKIEITLLGIEGPDKIFQKLLTNPIVIQIYEEETLRNSFNFTILSSYSETGSAYILNFSDILQLSKKDDNLFKQLNVFSAITLREKNSLALYSKIIENLSTGRLVIQLSALKELFFVSQENYERFYDFERVILKPLVEDINSNFNLDLTYNKVKKSEGVTSKVLEIEFLFRSYVDDSIIMIEDNPFAIKNKITNTTFITKIITSFISTKGIAYVNNNVNYALSNFTPPLDKYIINALKDNYYNKYFENSFQLKKKIEKVVPSLLMFESLLYTELSVFKFFYNDAFLVEFHKLKNSNYLYYEDDKFIIEGIYNGKKEKSIINIYKSEPNKKL